MHVRPVLVLIMRGGPGSAPASGEAAVAQQVVMPPALAQNGRGLFDESPETRASFNAVRGDRAPAEWIQEQDAVLSGGAAPRGPRIGFLYAGPPTQNRAFTQGRVSGLKSAGYTQGQDISVVWRFGEGHAELLPSLDQPRGHRLSRPQSREAASRRLAVTILGLDVETLTVVLRSARESARPPAAIALKRVAWQPVRHD
jgi:hypothetical protein